MNASSTIALRNAPPSVIKLALLLVTGFAAMPLRADIDRTKQPEPDPAPTASFPDYEQRVLRNGLKVFVIQDDRKPTVTFRLLIKSGSVFDKDKTGLAGFVAALLNRGTERRDAATFAQEGDFMGVRVEASANSDAIAVSAGGLTKYTAQILDLLGDAVLRPVFPAEQFAMEQRKVLSTLAAERQDPASLAEKLAGKVVFGGHPYGDYRTPQTVQPVRREDLAAFHQRHFLPNNASLAVVGDVNPSEVFQQVEEAFGDWKRRDLPSLELPPTPKLAGRTIHLVDRTGSVQSNISIMQPGPPRANPDTPGLNVLNATLGGGFSGRLFQNLRERHGWTYGAYSAFDMRKHAGTFEASSQTRNEVTHLAIGEMLKEINRLRTELVPAEELELQRQYNVGNYLLSLENSSRTAQRVQDIDLYGLPADFYKTYARRMAEVTSADVKSLAAKYLDLDNVAVVVVGEAKDVKEKLGELGPVFVYDTELKPVSNAP